MKLGARFWCPFPFLPVCTGWSVDAEFPIGLRGRSLINLTYWVPVVDRGAVAATLFAILSLVEHWSLGRSFYLRLGLFA